MISKEIEELIAIEADSFKIDRALVRAIVKVESSFDPWAVRYEPNWKYWCTPIVFSKDLGISLSTEYMMQATSFGLMQVMGAVAREYGYKQNLSKLLMPENSLFYGCTHLKKFLLKYPKNLLDAISCYNAGSVVKNIDGLYKNQDYVDKVLAAAKDLHTLI